jgi:hypothetical protein
LVNGDYIPIVGEDHGEKHERDNEFHGVHIIASKKDVVIQLGIDDIVVDENIFSA